ncbi:hypothetical protein [Pseudomonas phage PIP]|nr:hypothetical protein [Pseudomonas phage PIP]
MATDDPYVTGKSMTGNQRLVCIALLLETEHPIPARSEEVVIPIQSLNLVTTIPTLAVWGESEGVSIIPVQ